MTLNSLHIMIVDDEPAHAEAIRRALETADSSSEVRVAASLCEYRQKVTAHPPDIALLDLNLPDGRAVEVLGDTPQADPFPILIMTSHGNEQTVVEALKAGAFDYVVKSPETFAALPRTVERTMREWTLLQGRRRSDFLLQTRVLLSDLAQHSDINKLLQTALDAAEQLSNSTVGFSHFIEADQKTLHRQIWSTRTFNRSCRMTGVKHSPITPGSVWQECVSTQNPVIYNDCADLSRQWGLPKGHIPLQRLLVVPILRNDRVVAILGVGNKATDYTPADAEGVQELASMALDLVRHKQAEEELQKSEADLRSLFLNMQEGLSYCQVIYEDDRPCDFVHLRVNEAFGRLTGLKDVVGKRVSEVIPGLHDSTPELFEIYGRVACTGRPERFEIFVRPLQEWYSVSAYSPAKDCFVSVFNVITKRKRDEETRDATVEMLRLCNLATSTRELMRSLTIFFQQFSGCEAVGVRLKEGEDFPYYEARGFSKEFLLLENSLCAFDQHRELIRDEVGHPALDCMCGNVLCRRFDPVQPFFSSRGSFWSSNTSTMLASTSDRDRLAKTRNRCYGEGYESIALVPIRLQNQVFGLFQFNDRNIGRFDAEKIAHLETMIDYVAIALAKLKTEEALQESSQFNQQIINSAGEGVIVYDQELRYRLWNPFMEKLTGLPAAKILGRHPEDIFPFMKETGLLERLELARGGRSILPLEFQVKPGVTNFSGWYLDTSAPLQNTRGEIIGVIGTVKDITQRKRYEEELEYQATHDVMTGLANRNMLEDRLEQSLIFASRSNRFVAILLLDLDRFKVINDSLGHSYGDELLRMVAERLKDCVRPGDTVSRLGGDEFVITLAEVAELDDIGLTAQRIREKLSEPFALAGHDLRVTASIGISLYPKDGDSVESLIRHADIAMYRAKEEEGDTFRFFAPEMNLRVQGTLKMEADLRQGLKAQEFLLHYQPKVDIATGRIIGCEALLRWQHPQQGLVPPGVFIPLAEETGLIVPLGDWVLRTACAQARIWRDEGLPRLPIAVNLSARQFRYSGLIEQVQTILTETEMDPADLELELTESMIIQDPAGAADTMRYLKQIGVGLCLDDFGTGYSSLNYLRRFPVDYLKIDRSFITDVATDPSGAAVARSIVAIAHSLGIGAVAEGVENWEQFDFLVASQCNSLQGFLFSKPLPPREFSRLLKEGRTLRREGPAEPQGGADPSPG